VDVESRVVSEALLSEDDGAHTKEVMPASCPMRSASNVIS
jgi:hypothetical protein